MLNKLKELLVSADRLSASHKKVFITGACVILALILIFALNSSSLASKTVTISATSESVAESATESEVRNDTKQETSVGDYADNSDNEETETFENEYNEISKTDDSENESGQKQTTEEASTSAEDLINYNSKYPYEIYVNRAQNWVMVYGLNYGGNYDIPYKIFVCSVGREGHSTPLGTFTISDKYDWRLMVDGSYAQYAIRIYSGIMFHSVPYYSASKDDLETEEYNKLGEAASLGCIRLSVADVKWIYDNCPEGTTVTIYDDEDETPPLELPEAIKIDEDDANAGWDPTDPDENNPWN